MPVVETAAFAWLVRAACFGRPPLSIAMARLSASLPADWPHDALMPVAEDLARRFYGVTR